MYSFDGRIRYSEVDDTGRLSFHTLLDYFQDCSIFHSESCGIGMRFLEERHLAWVLVNWQVEVTRYPRLYECVRTSTWAYNFKGFYGWRNFLMTDGDGGQLACAASLWVLLNTTSGHPTKVLPEIVEAYTMSDPLPLEPLERKLKEPQGLVPQEPFAVQKFHLDTNRHVNNGKYILMAQEYLPEGAQVGKMQAEYRKSALYGDTIYPAVLTEGEKTVVSLRDGDGQPYVIVKLEEKHD